MPVWTISAPSRTSPFMTRPTLVSFPGMGCEDRITVSSGPILMKRFWLEAISASAEYGSPWEPVEITHTRPGSRPSTSSMSMSLLSGMCSRPIERASRTFLRMDRPSVATTRPCSMAASAICWMRWMWLEKQTVTMRRSWCSWNRS